ncbi:Serine/threonine-protein kinase Haspin-like protein [Hanseniaspora uvarum DSM 2768]|nr:Serine/threonine-protein kinase Haspin-like protein [Hanseniaspora uvarum DSM 2768]
MNPSSNNMKRQSQMNNNYHHQRWSMVSTSTNNSLNLNQKSAGSNFKRYSMNSLNHTSVSSVSLDTATLASTDDNNSAQGSSYSHRKNASVEESLVNINIERFSANTNMTPNNNLSNSNISSSSSSMSTNGISSSEGMLTNITQDTANEKKNSNLDRTQKRYSGYLNDYIVEPNFQFGSNTNNTSNASTYYKNTRMSQSKSISSLNSIMASANLASPPNETYHKVHNNFSDVYNNSRNYNGRRIPASISTVSLANKAPSISHSHSNASLNSQMTTNSHSSTKSASKWMFWRRKSMMNLSEYSQDNDRYAPNKESALRRESITPVMYNNNDVDLSQQSMKTKSSMDSLKSKIKMKLFQDKELVNKTSMQSINQTSLNGAPNIQPTLNEYTGLIEEYQQPSKQNITNDSPTSIRSSHSSPFSKVPKRASIISLKRPSKTNLRNKSSQQSLMRNQASKESLNTVTSTNALNTPTNIIADYDISIEDDDKESFKERIEPFINLCYKVDSISRVFERINGKDIYYQRDTTVVTKAKGNKIFKYLAFDTLDVNKIELILKDINITKQMTSLLRERMLEKNPDLTDVDLKEISNEYGICPIINMTLISNIFPEDYSKKNFHLMINNLYNLKTKDNYSCILKIEYFDLGIPMSIFLSRSPKPSSRVISKIFIKLINNLAKLEKIGFQHQDLNLDNIIINNTYDVFIIDYKMCKFRDFDTRLDHPIFYKRDSPHYEVYLEMRKVIVYIHKNQNSYGWCHVIWIKYILSKMLESINNNKDKHYDTLMNWLKFILKHQADLANCRDLISYQKKKKKAN